MIQNQLSKENSVDELKLDITNFTEETDRRNHEMEVVSNDLDKAKTSLMQQQQSLNQAKKSMQELSSAHQMEDQHLLKIKEEVTNLQAEVEQVMKDNKASRVWIFDQIF